MQIKIKNLRLENFKGIRELSIDAQGKNVSIYGENATGKTTIYDAFSWLLQEKDSQGKKDFGIKTLENGIVIEGIDHTVECEMDVDGKEMKLKKVYSEKWTKKTGTASKVLTGHTTDYFVDDVPCKKSEFESRMSQLISEDAIKLLTNPRYFNEQLHWLDRKKILFSLCDEIADTDVIAKMENPEKITGILTKRLPQDHKKVAAGRLKEINNQLEKLPVRIDELNKGMQGNEIDVVTAEKEIELLKVVQEKFRDELNNIKNGGIAIVNGVLISDLKTEISDIKTKMQDASIKKTEEWQAKLNALSELKMEYGLSHSKASNEKPWVISDIEDLEKRIQELRDEWKRINSQVPDIKTSCPTCNQTIPQEKQQEALKAFNFSNSEGLEIINSNGKELSVKLDSKKKLLEQLTKDIEKYGAALKGVMADIEKLNSQKAPLIIWINDEILAKQTEIERLEIEIKNDLSTNRDKIAEIATQIDDSSEKIEALRTSVLKSAQLKASKARIAELKAEQKKLSAEYENLESELFAINQFERIKCNLIEDTINSKFENAKFKLFNTLVNGGLEECCETLFDGVPYADLNNAAKTNVGIDIINTLSKQYDIYLPVFIDNLESITKLNKTNCQVFGLKVSEKDKVLRLEVKYEEDL